MAIIRREYDYIRDQCLIPRIELILDWLGLHGFKIIYYSRPNSGNPYYNNLEFLAQKEGESNANITEKFIKFESEPFEMEESLRLIELNKTKGVISG